MRAVLYCAALRNTLTAEPATSLCRYGEFTAYAYRSVLDGTEHVALVAGNIAGAEHVLARVHSESMLGDTFGSQLCDSGSQLDDALSLIAAQVRRPRPHASAECQSCVLDCLAHRAALICAAACRRVLVCWCTCAGSRAEASVWLTSSGHTPPATRAALQHRLAWI